MPTSTASQTQDIDFQAIGDLADAFYLFAESMGQVWIPVIEKVMEAMLIIWEAMREAIEAITGWWYGFCDRVVTLHETLTYADCEYCRIPYRLGVPGHCQGCGAPHGPVLCDWCGSSHQWRPTCPSCGAPRSPM